MNTWLIIALAAAAIMVIGSGGALVAAYEISTEGAPYLATIQAAGTQYGVPWELLAAQLQQESAFNPNAVSSAGAQGIAQFMPATAAQYGLSNPFDPTASIYAEAHLMSDLYAQYGSWLIALGAYNWGSGSVSNAISEYGDNWLQNAPDETQNYVATISANSGLTLT